LSSFAISFKGVCPTGTITKAEGSGIVVTAFASNQQTVTIAKRSLLRLECQSWGYSLMLV
jgi:hypothetical protein